MSPGDAITRDAPRGNPGRAVVCCEAAAKALEGFPKGAGPPASEGSRNNGRLGGVQEDVRMNEVKTNIRLDGSQLRVKDVKNEHPERVAVTEEQACSKSSIE